MTCPLCTDRAKSEIWRNGNFYLIDAEDPAFPCFLRVVSCRHVPEMSSLTSEERTELWGILNVVEEEIIKALRPHKVNLAQFGNMVPHLHWHVIARWQDDSHFPCFLRVVSCRHVPEMSSLTSEERTELWGILNVVEEEIIKALRPHKVNLAQFGNMVPHLHWHVIARWQDDSHFPECPWGPVQRDVPADVQAERRRMTEALKPVLREALEKRFGC